MRRGDTILFTGAGFSRSARNSLGNPMPLASDLSPIIWQLCYPGEPYDGSSRLDALFQVAQAKNPKGLRDALHTHLSVDSSTLPTFYADFFALPWYRAYTLNVDDLEAAIARTMRLPRDVETISAVTWGSREPPEDASAVLEVVHLNGILDDAPDGVTFSPTQYAERLAGQQPLYAQCAVDVLSRPVVYIGTPLDEAPLWQHVSLRRRGPRTRREFRRQSFIVTPALDRARRDLLEREFNVEHIPMSVEDFARELVASSHDVAKEGLRVLSASGKRKETDVLPLAQDLATKDPQGTADYLMGRAPRWGDIRDGIAAVRDSDAKLDAEVTAELAAASKDRRIILVTSTAGSGKTTSVMRLALALSARGSPVAWCDQSIDISPLDLRRSVVRDGSPRVIIIDEADRYGGELATFASDLMKARNDLVLILTMRSGRGIDRFEDRCENLTLGFTEFVLPNLSVQDAGRLIDVLDENNRLGELKNKARSAQISAIRDNASGQLIVALLEATSGRRFEELMVSELTELEPEQRDLYSIVSVATALRFGLTRDELLLATDDQSNATLASIDALQRRFLITSDRNGILKVRHRVIAEVLLRSLSAEGVLGDILVGLAIAAASKVTSNMRYGHPHYRRIRTITNHSGVLRELRVTEARRLYEELEPFLNWDHHYWLQRGSFELEHNELQLAENFLNQAYAIEPNDALVQTEVGYLRLKLATIEPSSMKSRDLLAEGFDLLIHAIRARDGKDPHQYHIYGRQTLEWLRRGDVTMSERERLLDEGLEVIEQGRGKHPRNEALRELYVDIQNERLGVTT
jgi:hypothetical protein